MALVNSLGPATDGDCAPPLAAIIHALASGERRALLARLLEVGDEGCSISALAEAAAISRFSASHHLGVLREGGLVTMTRSGYEHIHRVNCFAFLQLEDWLIPFLDQAE